MTALAAPLCALLAATFQGSFVERAEEVGLEHLHASGLDRVGLDTNMLDWTGSGIALGDVNGDGHLDAVCAGGLLPVHLFLGNGQSWSDATAGSGLTSQEHVRAPALGDYDADGDLDLFLGVVGPGDGPIAAHSRLYRNRADGVFDDVTALSGTVGQGHSLHARWADVDLDGLLDLITAEFHGSPNRLYLNHGDGTFRDASEAWGFGNAGSAHVIGLADSDFDGLLDAFVGNDFIVSSAMNLTNNSANTQLAGQPGGGFSDVSLGSGFGLKVTTMGITFGDVDYDGDQDVYQTEFENNVLQINGGWPATGTTWSNGVMDYGVICNETLHSAPFGETGIAVGWGTAFRHFDQDPWLDLVVLNGHVTGQDPAGQQNFIFRGLGPDQGFAFEDASLSWGFLDFVDDRALAVADADRDGDLDLFVGGVSSRLRYYENNLDRAGQGWIRVEAVCRTSAPGAAGVVASWTDSAGFPHVRMIGVDAPTASQNEPAAHFGLGAEPSADVQVEFPSGIVLNFDDVARDSTLVAEEPQLFDLPFRTTTVADGDETFGVAVFAHDAGGQALGASTQVDIEVEGLVPAGPVVHVGANRFERTFSAPTESGEHRVTARFDGFEVRVRPRLLFAERESASKSSLRLAPEAVRAGSSDTFRLEFVPRTRIGTAVGAGLRAFATIDGQSVELSDQGDGRYVSQLRAPSVAGLHAVDVHVTLPGGGRWTLPALGRLEVAGPAASFDVYLEAPDLTVAAEPSQLKGVFTLRDAAGLRLGPGAGLSIVVEPTPGSSPTAVLPAPGGFQEDGDYFFTLETESPGSASGRLRVFVDGQLIDTVNYAY